MSFVLCILALIVVFMLLGSGSEPDVEWEDEDDL